MLAIMNPSFCGNSPAPCSRVEADIKLSPTVHDACMVRAAAASIYRGFSNVIGFFQMFSAGMFFFRTKSQIFDSCEKKVMALVLERVARAVFRGGGSCPLDAHGACGKLSFWFLSFTIHLPLP
ncbi:hypothetical protein [uncultured Selenomonas sp.]|uniref:hypothetical protein n=1 Tax=uncultured Selenomonas sp. TaxID=159275 RepID=UPI00260048A8|nr:hypothetical protein [uncultured Selenomonas sp.]